MCPDLLDAGARQSCGSRLQIMNGAGSAPAASENRIESDAPWRPVVDDVATEVRDLAEDVRSTQGLQFVGESCMHSRSVDRAPTWSHGRDSSICCTSEVIEPRLWGEES